MSEEVKTKFKGPGQWRSQAQRLESDKKDEKDTKKSQKSG